MKITRSQPSVAAATEGDRRRRSLEFLNYSALSPGERVTRRCGSGEGVNALIIAPKRWPRARCRQGEPISFGRCDARRCDADYAVNSDALLSLIRLLPSVAAATEGVPTCRDG